MAKKTESNETVYHQLAKLVTDDGKVIGKSITAIKAAGTKLQSQIDLCAASCDVHAIVHGNVTPARDLISSVPPGFRANALRTWFEAKGPFVYNKETKELDYDKDRAKSFKEEYNKNKMAFASALMVDPAHVFSKEKEYQGFNFMASFHALVDKAEKASKYTGEKAAKVDLTGLDQAQHLLSFLEHGDEPVTEEVATV